MTRFLSIFLPTILLFILQNLLHAQDDYLLDTPTKKTFIEANVSINSARDFRNLNLTPGILFFDTVSYSLNSSDAIELQFRYTQDFAEQFSWYGGIQLGRSSMREAIYLRDSILVLGTGSNSPSDFFYMKDRSIYYASLTGGIRVSGRVGKNDRVYLNLGGKLTVYPKQDLSLSSTKYSPVRGENFTHNSSSTLDNSTKLNGSMEIDFSYHLITKNEKYRFIVGVLADRSQQEIFSITNNIVLPENTHNYEHSFSGFYVGTYIGFAYLLDSKEISVP